MKGLPKGLYCSEQIVVHVQMELMIHKKLKKPVVSREDHLRRFLVLSTFRDKVCLMRRLHLSDVI